MAGNIEQIEWYLAREGQQFGPLSDSELKKIIDLGHLKSDDLLWRDGMEEWEKSEKIFPPPAPPKPIFTAPPKPIFKDPNAPGPDEASSDAPSSQAQTNDQAETSTGTAETDADQALSETSDGKIADAEADGTINGAAETAGNPEDDTAVESVEDILETIAIDSNDDQDADANKEDAEFDRDAGTDESADLSAGKDQTDQPLGAAKDDTASSVAADTSTESLAKTANGSGELIGGNSETSAADPGELEDAASGDSAQDAATANSDQSSYETGDKNDKNDKDNKDNKDNKDKKVDEPKFKTKSRFKRNSIFRSKETSDAEQDPDRNNTRGDNNSAQDQSQSADAVQSDPEAKSDDKASADTAAKAENDAPTTTGSDLAPGIALKNGAEAGQSGGDAAAEAGSQSADDTNNTGGKAGGKTNDIAGDETVQPDASPSRDAKKSRFSFVKSLSLFRGSEPASPDSKTDSKTTSSNSDTTEPDKASITDKARHKGQLDHGKNKGPGNNAGTIAGKVAAIEAAAALKTPAKTQHPEAAAADKGQNNPVDSAATDDQTQAAAALDRASANAADTAVGTAAKTEPDKLNDNAKRGQQKVEKVDLNEIAKATTKSKKYRSKPAAVAEPQPQAPAPRQHGTHNIQRPHAATESRQGSRLGARQSLQQTAAPTAAAGPGSAGPVSAGPASAGAAPSAAISSGLISSGLISSGSGPNNASSDQRSTATPQARDARRGDRANHSPDGHRANSEHGWPADPRDAGAAANRQSAAHQRRRPQHGDQRTAASVAVAAQQQNGTTSHTAPRVQTPTHNRSAHGAPRTKAAPAPVLNSIAVRQAARVPASPAELNASLPAHAAPAGQIAPGNPAAGTAARGTAAPGQVARGPATRGQTTPAQAAPGAAAQRPPTQRHGVSGQALRGQVAARRAATGQAATGQAVPPYIAGASQANQGSIEALREPRRKRRRVVLPLLLLSVIGGAGWLSYTGQIEIPEQVQHYYSKALSIGKSLAASYIPGSGIKPGSVASKSPAATTNGQAPGAGNSLQVVLNKQPSSAPQLAVPQAVTLPGAADATSGSPGPGIAKTGQVIIFPQGQTPPATSSILSPSDAAQGTLDNAPSQPPSGSTQITRQIPAVPVLAPILAPVPVPVPVPAQPPGPPQNPLLSSQLWRYIEQEFPEWYNKRASEAMTLKEDNLDDHAIARLMDQKMMALRRRYASTALASSQSHLENIAASFLTMVNALSKHSVTACYGFISHGESAPEVAKLLQSKDYSRHLDAQSLAIIQAVVDGKNLPQTHKPPKPEDYRALAAELTKRGWSSSDLQLFTDPVALSNAKPAKVCSMVQDWFAAQLALPNSAAQLRLLVQSLRPVIAG